MSTPFLKWVGGKTRTLPLIHANLPPKPLGTSRYYEPFLGGGALFLSLSEEKEIGIEVSLSDLNDGLMRTWKAVRDEVESVIPILQSFQEDDSASLFYLLRKDFNEGPDSFDSSALFAATFIYLNRAGYNGVFRTNSKGKYNVPFSAKRNIGNNICLSEELRTASAHLQCAKLNTGSYDTILQSAEARDFVYLDPPYAGTFDKYTSKGFNLEDQEKLAAAYNDLSARGVFAMQSNSDVPFIRETYRNYNIIDSRRTNSVNSNPEDRRPKPDLLILNYDPR